MNIGSDMKPVVKILTAGEETAMEQKVNAFVEEHPEYTLVDLNVSQTTYHTRLGTTESGMMAVMVFSTKR